MKLFLPVCALTLLSACATTSTPKAIVPMDVSSGRPIVELMLNGDGPFPFVLDTGASAFVLRSSTVEQLQLTASGQSTISSPGGSPVPVNEVGVDDLSISDLSFGPVEAIYFEEGSMVSQLGAGVIGPVFLKDAGRTYLNFIDNELEIGGSFITPEDGKWIAFGESAPLLDVSLRFGDLDIPGRIDTGNPSIIAVPEHYAEELPLDSNVEVVGKARTVDREFEIRGAEMRYELQISDGVIPLENVRFFDRQFANLGMGALHGLTLEIDWQNERYAVSGLANPKQHRRRMKRKPATY